MRHPVTRSRKRPALAGLAFAAAIAAPHHAASRDFFFEGGLGLGGLGGLEAHVIESVERLPERVRYIPNHPDDGGFPDAISLDDKRLFPQDEFKLLHLRLGLGHPLHGKVRWAGGVEVSLPVELEGGHFDRRDDLMEANYGYSRDPARVYGAALTYYKPYYKIDTTYLLFGLRPSIFGEVNIKIGSKVSLAAGCEAFHERVRIEQGLDRYDSLEKRSHRTLGDFFILGPYLAFRTDLPPVGKWKSTHDLLLGPLYIELDGGIRAIGLRRLSEDGKAARFDYLDWPWFVNWRLGREF